MTKQLQTTLIPIQQGQNLAEALQAAGHPIIPTNVILDKTLTGIGATYMEIKAHRHSIIIEPNVPVIVGKTQEHLHTLGIYNGGATDKKIEDYLRNPSIKYKKLITTPESYLRIKNAADKLNINIFTDYFCLFDECEKIAQDVVFRENIIFPISDFFKFENKAFVSATPKIINHSEVKNSFSIFKIDPQFDYKIPIKIYATDKIHLTLQNYFNTLKDSKCICVFFNSITGINKLIQLLELKPADYMVFCSAASVDKLSISYVTAKDNFDSALMRKYNFFTCRYFSAVDMFPAHTPDVVLITDLNVAKHSMIDPESEAIQIQGRFRKTPQKEKCYNSLCHISNFIRYDFQTDEEVVEEFEEWKTTFLHLQQRYNQATSNNIKRAIEREFQSSRLYAYLLNKSLNETPRVNYFSVVNKYMTERIKKCYTSESALFEAYKNTDFYEPELIDEIDHSFTFNPETDIVIKLKSKELSDKNRIQLILCELNRNTNPQTLLDSLRDPQSAELFRFTQDVILAYNTFGNQYFTTQIIKTIRKDLALNELLKLSADRSTSTEFYQTIISQFADRMNIPLQKNECKELINQVYINFNILNDRGKPEKATQKTIELFFDVTLDNRTGINTVTLNNVLPSVLAKIANQ